MRGAAGALVFLAVAACSAAPRPAAATSPAAERPPLSVLAGYEIQLLHVTAAPGLGAGTPVAAGQTLGRVQEPPATLSTRHQAAIDTANARYDARQYDAALAAIEPAYRDEPENLFVAEVYARTLYRMGRRAEAFEPYRTLVAALDAQGASLPGAGPKTVVVDAWFADAYWKLGTLYMDRAEYDRAVFEISRCLASGQPLPAAGLDQAYSYLTKAHYHLGDYAAAGAWGRVALRHNPRNEYVRPYLDDARTR